jgi:ADP-ribose pyrophosphatase YjhB (NUDIX family)
MSAEQRPVFGARLFSLMVVRQDDRYLLVEERGKGRTACWYLPAGGLEPGEDFAAAAVRETREETGIVAAVLGILGVDQAYLEDPLAAKIRVVFAGEAVGGMLKKTEDEHSIRADWFRIAQAKDLSLRHPEVIPWLETDERLRDSGLPSFFGSR